MTNIWGFLNQTIYISSMAVLILLIKMLMKDKLPARWQYGIWFVMALCAFIPAGNVSGYIIPQRHILIEMTKTVVETGIESSFSSRGTAIYNTTVIPCIYSEPNSVTDFMFVIYMRGIYVYVFKYAVEYIRLGRIIYAMPPANEDIHSSVNNMAKKYNLTTCMAKEIEGITSAFVFGVAKPVLVIPKGKDTDEKVIIHELLHLKYKDLWQNVFWSFIKILHWPNPFIRYAVRLINNDMESLRDYRVMELLQGEERRDYGRILLSMTNDKYPSAFGTTSISNGGKFISERIQAIARFKLYPKGMELVSVCIIALLLPLTIIGNDIKNFPQGNYDYTRSTFTYQYRHARAKMTACKTVAGAMDTYAKAVITGNELYYLAVEPVSVIRQEYLLPDEIQPSNSTDLYYVVDLQKINSKEYVANLLFKDYKTNLEDPEGGYKLGRNNITIPVKIIKENGWKVYQTGDSVSNLSVVLAGDPEYTTIDVDGHMLGDRYEYRAPEGTVDIIIHKVFTVKNSKTETGFMFSQTVHNLIPMPNTNFSDGYYAVDIEYKPDSTDDIDMVRITAGTLAKMDEDSRISALGGYGGYKRNQNRRIVSHNIVLWRRKTEMERITTPDNTRFTDIQKKAVAEIMSKTEINFGELNLLKENFKSIRKVKGIHIIVVEDGRYVLNGRIDIKEGKLYDKDIQ